MKFEFVLSNTKKEKEMINSNDRLHHFAKAKKTSHLRKLGEKQALNRKEDEQFSKDNPCNIEIVIFSPTRRRLDPPNFYPTIKAILDGFTDAKFWTDDNYEIIKSMTFKYGGLSNIKSKYRICLLYTSPSPRD